MAEKSDITEKIRNALNEIQPYLQADNGGVELVEYSNNIIKIRFLGTCRTCEMQYYTFKAAIEEVIKNRVPEVKEIQIVH
ncbi:MAG: NifU family protein [Bacteroidia bacterium]|nr:MAG: NifU family protein [Bacteroidia bacterium]